MRLQPVENAGNAERQAYAFRLTGRGNAARQVQKRERIERLGNTFDRFEVGLEEVVEIKTQGFEEFGAGVEIVFLIHNLPHGGEAAAEEALIGFLLGHVDAVAVQGFDQNPDRKRFAVDEHAVAVEDHQWAVVEAYLIRHVSPHS
ncbi:hypothetical protein D3C87_1462450 [compost metagenome]